MSRHQPPGAPRPSLLALLAILLLPATAWSDADPSGGPAGALRQGSDDGEPPTPLVRARKVPAPPTIDGRLSEELWEGADVATGFVQFEPDAGAPATERTEVRITYDDAALYVGARMYDSSPDSVVARLARRDEVPYSDWFLVALDSYRDRRTAFAFGVNPRGIRRDFVLYDDTEEDASWDPVWEAAAERDSLGWTAEMRIPLSQLRFSPDDREGRGEAIWGAQFVREIARRDERSFWSRTTPDDAGIVSEFGDLAGLGRLEAPRRLEVVPYTLGSLTRAPGEAGDPFHSASDFFGSVGGDLRYGLTSDLTLSATLNPDFGQVEADPSVVNLSAFETRFPEKRPFFVEGADIFRFPVGIGDDESETLFYSRRIGRRPRGTVPDEAEHHDTPDATTILGAGKLSGKTAGGWSVGFLDAVTAEETAEYVDGRGVTGEVPVEPLTNYAVGRIRKDFRGGRSAVGGIFTATNRRLESDRLDFLPSAAYAGGIDARHRFGGGNYRLRGWVLGSHVRGSPEAIDGLQRSSARYFQRPDAEHLDYDPTRTSLTGAAANVELFKVGGGHWRWALLGHARSPGFEINDLGFQRNADQALQAAFIGYRQYRPGPLFRRWNVNVNEWSAWSFGGERLETTVNVNGSFQLHSFWGGWFGVAREFGGIDRTALRGGPAMAEPGGLRGWFGLHTDERKSVSGNLGGNWSVEDGTGGWSFSLRPGVEVRPSSRLRLSVRPSIGWNQDPWQYVDTRDVGGEDRYLMGRLEQTTASVTTRLSYTFTPDLSIQLYAQPFVSAGKYTGFREVADPRAPAFDDRFRALEGEALAFDDGGGAGTYRVDTDGDGTEDYAFGNPDFTFRQLRSNVVLRWQYRPGSTLFLVWSQGRTATGTSGIFAPDRDLDRLFGADGTGTLLIKATYWLGL